MTLFVFANLFRYLLVYFVYNTYICKAKEKQSALSIRFEHLLFVSEEL